MTGSVRVRYAIAVTVAAGVALFGLAGCGRLAGGQGSQQGTETDAAETTDLGWDAQALQSIGFSPEEMTPVAVVTSATPAPGRSAGQNGGARRKHRLLRYTFGKGMMHGEAVVQTEEGTKTVVVQRGTVTAIDAKSVTVKSTDGFTLVWTFGDPLTVLERRTQVQPSAVAIGTEVGIAGAKSGDSPTARLIVIPKKK
jgi:hypothetical protein